MFPCELRGSFSRRGLHSLDNLAMRHMKGVGVDEVLREAVLVLFEAGKNQRMKDADRLV